MLSSGKSDSIPNVGEIRIGEIGNSQRNHTHLGVAQMPRRYIWLVVKFLKRFQNHCARLWTHTRIIAIDNVRHRFNRNTGIGRNIFKMDGHNLSNLYAPLKNVIGTSAYTIGIIPSQEESQQRGFILRPFARAENLFSHISRRPLTDRKNPWYTWFNVELM